MKKIIFLLLGIFLFGCHSHDDGHHHGEDSHEPEYPTTTFTGWTNKTELFIDYPVLAVNKTTRFAAHFSSMETFKPLTEGSVEVHAKKNGARITQASVNAPSSPGLFLPEIMIPEPGDYDLVFYLKTTSWSDTFKIKNVTVFPSEDAAIQNFKPEPEGDEVAFTKEQAWKVDFAISKVRKGEIQNVIRTSGEILPVESAEMAITSTMKGVLFFRNKSLVEGQYIKKGTPLFTVNNDGVLSGNLGEKFAIVKAKLEQSKLNLDRSTDLLEKGIISVKELEKRKNTYAVNLAEFETLSKNFNDGGLSLTAPKSGILKKLNTTDGQFVNEGENLAVISSNTQLLVEAEVSQKYFKDIPNIRSANIKLPWQDEVVNIKDYNGKIVSTIAAAKDHFIPVTFKIDNRGDLVPGTYLEVYLLTNKVKDVLTIPTSALLKDYDTYTVYVMTDGEAFEKRNLKIGINDGENVQILSGINEGEMVVTKGAYAIKMASMSSSIPAHGHEH